MRVARRNRPHNRLYSKWRLTPGARLGDQGYVDWEAFMREWVFGGAIIGIGLLGGIW